MVRQRGFSMVEVLVSVLVLAVGVIGAVGMQLTAMRATQESSQQSIALQLGAELASQLAALSLANDERSNLLRNGFFFDAASEPRPPSPAGACFRRACEGPEATQFELDDWLARAQARLPGLRVAVCRDDQPWNGGEQSLRWPCNQAATDASYVIKLGWRTKEARAQAPQLALVLGALP